MEHLAHEPPCCYLCAISVLSICYLMLSLCYLMLSLCYLYAISVLSLCYLYSLALEQPFLFVLSLCYLCAIYALLLSNCLFCSCYLCAISVLSMLSHAGGYFFLCAISVLSLCYLCYLMLSLCYLCAISVLSLCYLYDISRKFASTYTNSGLATSAQDWFNLLTSRVESSPAHELSFLMGIHRYIHIQAVCPLSIHIYIYISEAVCPL